ncbi:hypothetical protein CBP36_19400 (plasmid) [Acidovorax carolinensis]|uniref:Uncharacterized protein n=2 Tax=Acidovorax carolinensis TaxID=553814 RepID=A0A240UI15_9BURK|nr:hypothetical protein CBP35_19355 [Acidovorax carolinensis]ART61137.1 hypothetical protein CBP36_19400 [Acidovorax carolinensis]
MRTDSANPDVTARHGQNSASRSAQPSGQWNSALTPQASHEEADEDPGMRLRVAWLIWLVAIGAMWFLISRNWYSAGFWVYLGSGFIMTRIVYRRLVGFHPMHNTLSNVVSAKLWMFFAWPLNMFMLLAHLSINRIL